MRSMVVVKIYRHHRGEVKRQEEECYCLPDHDQPSATQISLVKYNYRSPLDDNMADWLLAKCQIFVNGLPNESHSLRLARAIRFEDN